MLRFIAIFCVASITSLAHGEANNCDRGWFGEDFYTVKHERMDDYGNFKSAVIFSKAGEFQGEGRYFVSEDGQFAYLEAKYKNPKAKLQAVLSVDYQGDGGFLTLCMGKNLKKKDAYECTSCVIRYEREEEEQ